MKTNVLLIPAVPSASKGVLAAETPKAPQEVVNAEVLVASTFPDKSGWKRRIIKLFNKGDVQCFRVNYLAYDGLAVESSYVEVHGNKAVALPEPLALPSLN